jgi:hypothetical protein
VSPKCQATCQNTAVTYGRDKHFGSSLKQIPKGDIVGIQREIFNKGSVVAAFMVHESLMEYNGGVYYKDKGADPGKFIANREWSFPKFNNSYPILTHNEAKNLAKFCFIFGIAANYGEIRAILNYILMSKKWHLVLE